MHSTPKITMTRCNLKATTIHIMRFTRAMNFPLGEMDLQKGKTLFMTRIRAKLCVNMMMTVMTSAPIHMRLEHLNIGHGKPDTKPD